MKGILLSILCSLRHLKQLYDCCYNLFLVDVQQIKMLVNFFIADALMPDQLRFQFSSNK